MEKLYIGDDICVTVVRVEGGRWRLGSNAPREISVVRAELVGRRVGDPGCDQRACAGKPERDRLRYSPSAASRRRYPTRANGFDEVARIAELLPKALDVNIDGSLRERRIFADRGIHQLETRECAAGWRSIASSSRNSVGVSKSSTSR